MSKRDYKNTVFTLEEVLFSNIRNTKSPGITFEKISNASYKVNVRGAKDPFILVLNSTFDKSWQAKIGKEIITKHLTVNGFANGWIVERLGSYEVNISLKVWPWD